MATTAPFLFRSPAIQVDSRIVLSSIQTVVESAVDNNLDQTGVSNATHAAGTFANTASTGFGGLSTSPTLTSGPGNLEWVHGANQLLLRIRNAENNLAAGPMGIYAKVTINATCTAAPVAAVTPVPADAPWALLLAGAGVAALTARRMRRR